MKILLIDDEWDSDSTRVADLRDGGHTVLVTNRVSDALASLADTKTKIDLVLLDVMMPPEQYATLEETNGGRFTGIKLLSDIRKYRGNVPVVLLSAHNASALSPYLDQVSRSVQKPIQIGDLLSILNEVGGSHDR